MSGTFALAADDRRRGDSDPVVAKIVRACGRWRRSSATRPASSACSRSPRPRRCAARAPIPRRSPSSRCSARGSGERAVDLRAALQEARTALRKPDAAAPIRPAAPAPAAALVVRRRAAASVRGTAARGAHARAAPPPAAAPAAHAGGSARRLRHGRPLPAVRAARDQRAARAALVQRELARGSPRCRRPRPTT